jgi:hypothetical protein
VSEESSLVANEFELSLELSDPEAVVLASGIGLLARIASLSTRIRSSPLSIFIFNEVGGSAMADKRFSTVSDIAQGGVTWVVGGRDGACFGSDCRGGLGSGWTRGVGD